MAEENGPETGAAPGSAAPESADGAEKIKHDYGARFSGLERFLLFLSKTDLHALQFCTPETRMTQTALGVMVLITAFLAWVSSFFAIHSSFFGKESSLLGIAVPVVVASVYALAIAFFDREIVAATTKVAGIPRALLAILIGIVIAFPIKLKLLEGRIDAEIVTMVEERNKPKTEEMEKYLAEIAEERANLLAPHRARIEALQSQVRMAMDELEQERKRVACRVVCEKRIEELKQVQTEYDKARDDLRTVSRDVEDELARRYSGYLTRIEQIRREIDAEKRSSYDFLSQAMALSRIISENPTAAAVSLFVMFFFIALELFPVVIKWCLPYSEYNAYLDARRRLNVNRIITVTNYSLKEIADHPALAHLRELEITDILEKIMEDRSVDVHGGLRASEPRSNAAGAA
jgi:hypothetical protein